MNNLILDYMEQTAARLPEKTAFADEQTSVAFAALVCRAKKVASALIPLVPPRSVVGFYMDKGVETVVGFMGAVYAGCAYSQLNLRHPAPRVRAMLETLDTPIVVTDRTRSGLVAASTRPTWPPQALPTQSTGSSMPSRSRTSVAAAAQSSRVKSWSGMPLRP